MAKTRGRLRVATWNVHGCVGRDRRYDPARTAGHLQALKPDIAALQEVDSRHAGPHGEDPVNILTRAVGDHTLHAPAILAADGHYGQLLVSRWPLDDTIIHDVSVDGREPRRIIEAHVNPGGTTLRVLATHFGLSARERRIQLRRLRAIIADGNDRIATIVMGDFNDWRWRGPVHRGLSDLLHGGSRLATFPARLPLFPLDRILWRPAQVVVKTWIVHDGRHASDHLALAADLRIR